MATTVLAHRWRATRGLKPAVVWVTEMVGPMPGLSARIHQPEWVLDEELRPFGRYRIGGARSSWRARQPRVAHLYAPNTTYWEDTREATGRRHSVWMTFTGGEAAGLVTLLDPKLRYARFLDEDGRLGDLLRDAARVGTTCGDAGFWQAQSLLCRSIDLLHHAQREDDSTWRIDSETGGDRDDDRRDTAAAFAAAVERDLREQLGERVTLEAVAGRLHVSRSTLAQRYREATGRSVMQRLTEMRLEQARSLLRRGEPLKTIASTLGFADAYHFSRTFKRIEGVTPRAYRQGLG